MGNLRAVYSVETAMDVRRAFITGQIEAKLGVAFNYVPPVRWWEFWWWRRVGTQDYHYSRVADDVTVRDCARRLREEIDG